MQMKYWFTSILAFGFAIAAWGQQSAPPVPKPADHSPTLAATMQFIQEKLSEQGKVGWAQTMSNHPGWTTRIFINLSDVMADPAACTLYTTETIDSSIEPPKGTTFKPSGGKQVTADDFRTHAVETDSVPFKLVEKITVEKMQDVVNQDLLENAHPEINVTVTPPVFYVKLWASSAVFSTHTSTTKGNQAPVEKDATSNKSGYTFRDEESANHMAKAMIHAMELCGGGVTKKELL